MIDLRSDTVTKPGKPMLDAMYRAELGDDVYREDPSINALEELAAHMLGKEAAIFAPSGTQTNLLALMSHCQRGDEYIVGQRAHTYRYEAGGAAVLGSIQPQPVENQPDGRLDLSDVAANIKEDDYHFARTRLLCLENTYAGQALPMDYLHDASQFSHRHKLRHHLDGARIFNAAVKHDVDVKRIADHFDSVSVCLSKGLGAPVGSVLCGSQPLIDAARRHRKMLGGGMRQAGVLAAAGIYALENNVARLAEDHENAQRLAKGLQDIEQLNTYYPDGQTNMVFVEFREPVESEFVAHMKQNGILITENSRLRLVTHLDISEKDIDHAIAKSKEFFTNAGKIQ